MKNIVFGQGETMIFTKFSHYKESFVTNKNKIIEK